MLKEEHDHGADYFMPIVVSISVDCSPYWSLQGYAVINIWQDEGRWASLPQHYHHQHHTKSDNNRTKIVGKQRETKDTSCDDHIIINRLWSNDLLRIYFLGLPTCPYGRHFWSEIKVLDRWMSIRVYISFLIIKSCSSCSTER